MLGNSNTVDASNAVAIGNSISVTGANAIAIGQGSSASASNSVALGAGSVASAASTVSVGSAGNERKIVNVADGSIASGSTDAATGGQLFTANQRVAAAFGTTLDGTGQINAPSYTIQSTSYGNVGSAFSAVDVQLTSINNSLQYLNVNSTGPAASATGTNAIAIGSGAVAIGSVAVGSGASAGSGGAAFGDNAVATGSSATAAGPGANATLANSAAFGNGATATRANQQVFGTASNTYTMPGVMSAASRAAQSGPTQVVTSDASGNLATASLADLGLASAGDIAAINSQLATINGQVGDLYTRSNKAYSGVAMAFAMAGVPTLMPGEKFAATLNYGTFQGQSGFAINTAVRLADSMQLTAGIGYGANEQIAGGRAGLRFAW